MLVKNINDAILKKKQKKMEKAEKPSKSRICLLKAEEVAALILPWVSVIIRAVSVKTCVYIVLGECRSAAQPAPQLREV